MLAEIADGEITAPSAGVLVNKLLQMTSGAVYDEDRNVLPVHDAKLDALRGLLDKHRGEPVLILTAFKHESARILAAIPEARMLLLGISFFIPSAPFPPKARGRWGFGALPGTDFRDPGAVLSGLNNAFLMEKQNNMYFTMWYGVYHVPSRTLKHASGGHPAALLMTPSGGTEAGSAQLRSPGLIIGAIEDTVYETRSFPVAPGETLLVLCDGCYEIKDVQGNFMEFETFEQFMRQHVAKPDALDRLYDWVCERHGEGPLDDDFSIVRINF